MAGYDASAIEVLTGLEPVRRRPGMYTATERPNHLAQEAIDNAVDEAVAGYARRVEVTLHADGSLSVADDGRGMPVDVHKEHKVSGVELILTRLHSGAKFERGEGYAVSGGLHGVGAAVVNALSTRLDAEIRRDGFLWRQTYTASVPGPLDKIEPSDQTGTTITFWADAEIFSETIT